MIASDTKPEIPKLVEPSMQDILTSPVVVFSAASIPTSMLLYAPLCKLLDSFLKSGTVPGSDLVGCGVSLSQQLAAGRSKTVGTRSTC